jgi:hypothetical protein
MTLLPLLVGPWRTSVAAAILAATAAAAAGEGRAPAGAPAETEGVHEGLFATGVLEELEDGESLVFRHERSVEPDNTALPDFEGTAAVSVVEGEAGGREARVKLVSDGRDRPVPPLPADAGHPLLLIFLETAVRTTAEATGGSPFYIRNRIREKLWTDEGGKPVEIRYQGEAVEAEELVYRPFASDPNRARMGGFADLELRFLVSDALPGRIGLLELQSPEGDGAPEVSETLALEGLEEGEPS